VDLSNLLLAFQT